MACDSGWGFCLGVLSIMNCDLELHSEINSFPPCVAFGLQGNRKQKHPLPLVPWSLPALVMFFIYFEMGFILLKNNSHD